MEPPLKRARDVSSEVDEIITNRKEIMAMLPEQSVTRLRELLSYSFHRSFSAHRDNHYDKLALLDCSIEIIMTSVDMEKQAMDMCTQIQAHLSNNEIRQGWRVSFGCCGKSHRFFYLNDRMKKRRSISFRCVPEP